MPTLVRDLKHAVRQLRARPGFALLAIVSLAIGIGAPSVVFTAVDATLLRRLPVRTPQQLVEVDLSDSIGAAFSSFAYPNVRDLAARTRSLAGMAAWDTDMLSVATDGDPTLAIGEFVTGNYFSVLGTSPQLGRFFAADEDGPSTARAVAVVSDAFWRTRLGADPHAIGRMLSINGVPFTLIGVAAPEVAQVSAILKPDVWTTMGTIPLVAPQMAIERRTYSTFQAIGRLRPGIETTAAARELSALQHGIDAEHPEAGTGRTVRLFPLTSVPAEFRSALLPLFALLMSFAGLITLVACGNVASMLLARGLERRREIAIRGALGASRTRLVAQIATETVLIFVCGAAAGIGLTYAATRAFAAFHPPVGIPVSIDLPVDWRVLAFTLLLALVVGTICGVMPALRSTRSDVATVLKSESSRIGGRSRGRSLLVIGQVGFTLMLLVGAGLVVRALTGALSLDPGFRHADVHIAVTDLAMARLSDSAATRTAYAWTDAVAAATGVEHVALTSRAPLGSGNSSIGFLTGPVPATGRVPWKEADWAAISPTYFDALAIPMVAGRAFTRSDDASSQPVTIVSEAFAARYFGGPAQALGRLVNTGRKASDRLLVVGVARDTKVRSPVEAPRMMLYQPLAQTSGHRLMMLVVSDRSDVGRVVGDALHRVNSALPLATLMSFDDYIGVALLPQRIAAIFAAVLGIAGLILASLGVFGVVAYAVTQRHHEIGVRLAIGATPSNVVATIARSGLRLLAVGVALGLVLSLAAARAMGAFLLGVSPFDPATFAAVVAGVTVVGVAASALPASRAARVDPVAALRAE